MYQRPHNDNFREEVPKLLDASSPNADTGSAIEVVTSQVNPFNVSAEYICAGSSASASSIVPYLSSPPMMYPSPSGHFCIIHWYIHPMIILTEEIDCVVQAVFVGVYSASSRINFRPVKNELTGDGSWICALHRLDQW